jgi:hypothetical protein
MKRDDILKQCLTFKGNHKWYSTELRQMTSTVLLKHGKNDGIAGYVPKETILEEMEVKIELVKPACFFFNLVWELSDSTLYMYTGCYTFCILFQILSYKSAYA